MVDSLMYRFSSLKFRLAAGSILILLTLFGVYSLFTVWNHDRLVMTQVRQEADRISEFIKLSTHHSMLENRKEEVYRTMRMIGGQEGVEGLRIYNKKGVITFSTDSTEQGTSVDLQAEACVACHAHGEPLSSLPTSNRIRLYESASRRVLGLINPIKNQPSCAADGCHASPAEQTVLGVLDVRMSLARIDEDRSLTRAQTIFVTVIMAAIVALLSLWFFRRTIFRPVDALAEGTRQLSGGNLDYRVRVQTNDELGALAGSFNRMTGSIQAAQQEIRDWSETLERRVQQKTEELTAIHDRIAHVEKMSSLGRLSATVAHELNNPLEGILTYAKLLKRQFMRNETFAGQSGEWKDELDVIVRETNRCGDIVKNLLLFSKKESGEFVYESVGEIVDRAYRLMKHHLEMRDIQYALSIPDPAPHILCDPQQIQQALVAMIVNAADAMNGGGTLTVETRELTGHAGVELVLRDTGYGIEKEHLEHIFEPFYTTKEGGTGVGLGLSVVYGIIQRHDATIKVDSTPGKGTVFTITFPSPDATPSDENADIHIQTREMS